MSNKQNISKHRSGGPHGGQAQSNQRPTDYQRPYTGDRTQGHIVRPGNAAGPTHLAAVQMPPQPAQNPMQPNAQQLANQTMHRPHGGYSNNQPLLQQQPINMAHVQNNMMSQRIYPANTNRHTNQVRTPNVNQFRPLPAPTNVPTYANMNPTNYQQYPGAATYYQNNFYLNQAAMPGQPPSVPFFQNLYYMTDPQMAQLNPQYRFIPPQMNMAPGTPNELSSTQPVQPKKTKREKNLVPIYNVDGSEVFLPELAEKSLASSSKASGAGSAPEKNTVPPETAPLNGNNQVPEPELKAPEDTVILEPENSKLDQPVLPSVVEQTQQNKNEESPAKSPEDSSGDLPEKVVPDEITPDVPVSVDGEIDNLAENIEEITMGTEENAPKNDSETDFEVIQPDEIEDVNRKTENATPLREDDKSACETLESGDVDTEPESEVINHETPITDDGNVSEPLVSKDDNESDVDLPVENSSNAKDFRYPRDFLLSLREKGSKTVIGNSNQENIRDIMRKSSPANSSDSLLPSFYKMNNNRSQNDSQYRNKSQVQQYRSRLNQQPSGRNFADSRSRKAGSLIPMDPHDDRWRIGRIQSSDPEEIETEKLLKSVRAILNKLTPQNYQSLLDQFKNLKIDTKDRLTKVIDLIFDKAVREPGFVVQYAGFCSQLVHIKVLEVHETDDPAQKKEVQIKFKNLLIEKCQNSFYQEMYADIKDLNERVKEIEECENPVKKKELEELLDDDKRLSRKRSVGNIKLIAELYKLNMLNASIMFACFDYLLKHQFEEYIECLCALITNIGKNLTDAIKAKFPEQGARFDAVFKGLDKIYRQENPDFQVSSRIRFMILDLNDLRKNNWVPRRKAEGPKLISQVHEDLENQKRLKNESLNDMRKKKNSAPQQADDWTQVNASKRKAHPNISFKNLTLGMDLLKDMGSSNKSGRSDPFALFSQGSHGGGSTPNSQSRSSSSNYENKAPVSSSERNQRAYHDSLSAKDSHLRRDERKTSDVTNYHMEKRSSSSGSQTRSKDNFKWGSGLKINEIEFNDKISTIVSTYLASEKFSDTIQEILKFCSKSQVANFISISIISSMEKTSQKLNPREKWGQFLGQFFQSSLCEPIEIFESLKIVFGMSEDMKPDIPMYFQFVGEILAHALLTISEDDAFKRKDILRNIVNAYKEISGNDCALFRDSLISNIEKKNPKFAEEIRPLFQSTATNSPNNDTLRKIVDSYIATGNLQELNTQIKSAFSDELSPELKSALYFTLLSTMNESDVKNSLEKIKNALEHYVQSEEDQDLLLLQCSSLSHDLNDPSNLLNEIFNYLRQNKLVKDEAFIRWKNNKNVSNISKAATQRFFTGLEPIKL